MGSAESREQDAEPPPTTDSNDAKESGMETPTVPIVAACDGCVLLDTVSYHPRFAVNSGAIECAESLVIPKQKGRFRDMG
jgi:hypothetical protein